MERKFIYDSPVYDLRELSRRNLHIHTCYSRCGKADMLVSRVVAEADRAGLEMIAFTDHFNYFDFDGVCLAQCAAQRLMAEKIPHRVKILYGAELSNYDIGKQLELPETNAALDIRLYACNHFQMEVFVHPEDRTARGYALHLLKATKELMLSGKADCVAHPLIGMRVPVDDIREVGLAMTDSELGDICELSRTTHTALELNRAAIGSDPGLYRRLYNLGREAGAFFHFGSDAHSIEWVDPSGYIGDLERLLN
ncbi:MAG: PHP domain-containing protein [Ruminococcaceae bacterium]|nr:PHP domain-containing protein [Oscillospiraceae bacterium]